MSALFLLVALCALLSLFPFVIVDAIRLFQRLAFDNRGVLPAGMVNNVLADRGDGGTCNLPRIPTGRYPHFSKTMSVVLDANGNGTITLEAERDLLLLDLSVVIPDETPTSSTISLTYCNVRMLDQSSKRNWAFCCASKPAFCLGVRENKKAEFVINGGTPTGTAYVTVNGFQGNGCCG